MSVYTSPRDTQASAGHAWYRVTRYESEQNGTPNTVVRYNVWADDPSHAVEKVGNAIDRARRNEHQRFLPVYRVRAAYKLRKQPAGWTSEEAPYGYTVAGLEYA